MAWRHFGRRSASKRLKASYIESHRGQERIGRKPVRRRNDEFYGKFVADHGHEEVRWCGEAYAPLSCKKCELVWPFMVYRRDKLKGVAAEVCSQSLEASRVKAASLIEFKAKRTTHAWDIAPSGTIMVCKKCGFYLTQAPHGLSYACKPCGITRYKPWLKVDYRNDWSRYLPLRKASY